MDARLKAAGVKPLVADYVTTWGMMLTLVAAGYGIGFALGTHVGMVHRQDIVARPFDGRKLKLSTYLLRIEQTQSDALTRFIDRIAVS